MVIGTIDTGLSPITYPTPEPLREMRLACERALTEVGRAFVNESVQATTRGFKELDGGQFVTLEDLERRIKQGVQKGTS